MNQIDQLQARAAEFKAKFTSLKEEVAKVIVGQERVIEIVLTALICDGNVLLEGVPGLGKTELVKTLSAVLDLDFKRIQFTPDLMPADIIGTNILSEDESGSYKMEFREGPVFTQLLLADEINRATPKTQSALLESMQEKTVTVGRETWELKEPFFVLATQNPLEHEGTYPLPEAQLDRFMFKVKVPFPGREDLNEIVSRTTLKKGVKPEKILPGSGILELRDILSSVVVVEPVRDYAVRLVLATHSGSEYATENVNKYVAHGGSPRAVQALVGASRVRALSEGRVHVAHEDIRFYAGEALQHRLIFNYDGQAENLDPLNVIEEVIASLPQEV